MEGVLVISLCCLFIISCNGAGDIWSPVDKILEASVMDEAFPGCVAIVGNQNVYTFFFLSSYFFVLSLL